MEVAGANRRGRCGCNPRRESAVAQLSTLGIMNAPRLLILILAFACSGCAWRSDVTCATSGKVLDETTKQPVVDARLYDKRYPKQVVTTTADGSFDFQRIMAWHHVSMLVAGPDLTTNRFLIVEASGYRTVEVDMPLQFDWPNRIIYLTPTNAP
jgi:hypothetical protein